jgi:hypothetical protein
MNFSRYLPYGQIMPEPHTSEPTAKEQLRMRQIELFDSNQTQIIENLQKSLLELSESGARYSTEILNLTLAIKENVNIIESSNGIYPMYAVGESEEYNELIG